MKRWIIWITVALTLLVVFVPARVIYWASLPADVVISDVSGSLWQGKIGSMQIQGVPLTDVSWDWQLSALLSGQLAVDVNVPTAGNPISVKGKLQAGFNSVSVDNLTASGDLSTLLLLANTQLPLTTRGDWTLNVAGYRVSDPTPVKWCNQLTADATGNNIQVLVNGAWQSLGDFPVALSCADSGAVAMSMNGNNSLGLAFDGSLNSNDINLSGTVRPNPRTPEGLAKMFQYLGQPDSQGRYPFSL